MTGKTKDLFKGAIGKIKRFWGDMPAEEIIPVEEFSQEFTQKEKEKAGWVSPNYSKTRTVKLDPALLADRRCVGIFPYAPEAEVYKVLRTQILQYTKEAGGNTIMITSALPGEGKTLTAINLAFTFAKLFSQTVLLVDGDLKQQAIHQTLGFPSDLGLIDYLVDGRPVFELMVWPGVDKLTLISGGRTVHESTELLGSPRMSELVTEMKTRYPDRYVFFDVPPILSGADTLDLVPLVDHVIMVVQYGVTPIDDVKKAVNLIPQEKLIGFVLNRQDVPVRAYPVPEAKS